jgi:hypothetical protein
MHLALFGIKIECLSHIQIFGLVLRQPPRFTPTFIWKSFVGANLVFAFILLNLNLSLDLSSGNLFVSALLF